MSENITGGFEIMFEMDAIQLLNLLVVRTGRSGGSRLELPFTFGGFSGTAWLEIWSFSRPFGGTAISFLTNPPNSFDLSITASTIRIDIPTTMPNPRVFNRGVVIKIPLTVSTPPVPGGTVSNPHVPVPKDVFLGVRGTPPAL